MAKTKTSEKTAELTKRCDWTKLKVGDVASRHSFLKIIGITKPNAFNSGSVRVQNAEGKEWDISPEIVEAELSTANQSLVTVTSNRTALIGTLMGYPRTAMTVTFRKKVEAEWVAGQIKQAIADGLNMTDKAWKKKINEILEGELRTLVGYHEGKLDAHGRLMFTDAVEGFKLVDPRTVEKVVVDNTTYEVNG